MEKRKKFKKIILYFAFILLVTGITFVAAEPFAIFDFPNFWHQINEQKLMTRDAFVFPYTLQYVNTLAYFYPLKNIVLWGLGPIIGLAAVIGFIYSVFNLIRGLFTPGKEDREGSQLIIYSFCIIYFLVVGGFAVKFMRYYLPLYPVLAISAAYFLFKYKIRKLIPLFLVGHLIWLMTFLSIYTVPNTRIQATSWINKNIPAGSTVLREHWDDSLPLGYNNSLKLLDLPLYDYDDDPEKWKAIEKLLNEGDYLIIASNRLYKPLQKLTDCQSLPEGKCYTNSAQYYQKLFSEQLGYIKVAEFSNYPKIFGITINDENADESFTVYDHPKVIIFKKAP